MNGELVVALLGGAGFLAGVSGLLNFLNNRRSARTKGSADAYLAWRTFTSGAFEDRDREHERVVRKRDSLFKVRGLLIDLVQDLIVLARARGATVEELEPFQDRLDAVREM